MKQYLFITTIILYTQNALAQISSDSTHLFETVEIFSNKDQRKKYEVAHQLDIINTAEIRKSNAQTSADLLQREANIFVQKSQGGGGSTILRGFEANKVLITFDGVRINNAIFRGGHLQNVLRIDANDLKQVEVLYGPSSVLYGSDAIGGSIHFYTQLPKLNTIETGAFARYSSANNERTMHANFNYGFKSFAWRTSITYNRFGDILQGKYRDARYPDFGKLFYYSERINNKDSIIHNKNANLQVGTAYNQFNVLSSLLLKHNEQFKSTFRFFYTSTSNVNRYDRLSEMNGNMPKYSEWYYGPEKQLFAAYSLQANVYKPFADVVKTTLAYQYFNESRNSRRLNNATRKVQDEKVKAMSLNIDANKVLREHNIAYGGEVKYDIVNSKAHNVDILNQATSPTNTRYPDGNNGMFMAGVFVNDKVKIDEHFSLESGLRYNYTQLKSTFIDTSFFNFPFNNVEQKTNVICWNFGGVYAIKNGRVSANVSRAYRTPNIDDMAKVFDSAPGTIVVPNESIKPEWATSVELNFNKHFAEKFELDIALFRTYLSNAIVVDKAPFNGNDSIVYDGVMSQVLKAQNKDKAQVTGLSAGAKWNIYAHLILYGNVNYQRGRIIGASETPLDHIPPTFGRIGLESNYKQLSYKAWIQFADNKPITDYLLGGEDNEQYATVDGMPAWHTVNIACAYTFKFGLAIQLACENIFDKNYRHFASGVSAAGRDFRLTARYNFNKSKK